MSQKRCSRCGVTRARSEFHANRLMKDGLQRQCKSCRRAHYLATREKVIARVRKNVLKNPKRRLAYNRVWRRRNLEKVRESARQWSRRNRAAKAAEQSARRAIVRAATAEDSRAIRSFYEMVRTIPRLRCFWCKRVVAKKDRNVDHIIPLRRGGQHRLSNLCCACSSCNRSKCARLPSEFTGQQELIPRGGAR